VLHPRCILPAKQGGIPLWVYATQTPKLEGTHISADSGAGAPQVKAVCVKKGITLISLDSPGMWHQVGFMADAFQIFKQHGMSVDQVSTSETNVTVSLDPTANTLDQAALERLTADLAQLCRVQFIGPCAQVSLVGRNIRGILHQLGEALELFADHRIHMVSQAANDLNFTFVIDEDQGDRLVQQLHELLIQPVRGDKVLGPTWEQLYGSSAAAGSQAVAPWWRTRRAELLAIATKRDCAYVYDAATISTAARSLQALQSVDQVFYAMKANPNIDVLRLLVGLGVGVECVSRGEIEHLLNANPRLERSRILFTPNFAARAEYEWALTQGVNVTVDNLYILEHWPEVFAGRELLVRVDSGVGRGHHKHVQTAGQYAKFGVPLEQLPELAAIAERHRIAIIGLHAHPGSGIFDVNSWVETLQLLFSEAVRFPRLRVVNIGGGLGVPESLEQATLDLAKLDQALAPVRAARTDLEVWMEPGRYLVAQAGVLIARVNQLKSKEDIHYVGIATGMNSLIRPALYGAWHDIVNLTRIDVAPTLTANVVGPICESADYLGHDRLLPPTQEGDVLLIATAGAYGHAMASHYNLREPAAEFLI
jgi:diaminopimelate decarboxylase/aspartate kinase